MQEGEQAAGAAADVEAVQGALDCGRPSTGRSASGRAAHDVGGAGEQHLDLGVVERRRLIGQPTAALEVEMLAVVVGQAVVLSAGRSSSANAARGGADRPAAVVGNSAGCGAGIPPVPVRAWGRQKPGLDMSAIRAGISAHVGRQLGPRRRQPDRKSGLGISFSRRRPAACGRRTRRRARLAGGIGILKWLQTTHGCEVVTFTADLGQGEELGPARQKAEMLGIKPENIFIEDLREEFVRDFVFPMFRANALYEGQYCSAPRSPGR